MKGNTIMNYKQINIVRKYSGNPILTPADVPFPAAQVYNAGITKFNGKYVMIFRDDYGRYEEDFRKQREISLQTGEPYRWPPNTKIIHIAKTLKTLMHFMCLTVQENQFKLKNQQFINN